MYICLCVYVYVHVFMSMCSCLYVFMSLCVYVSMCLCLCIHVYMSICLYVHVSKCLCVYVHVHVYVSVCMSVCLCVCVCLCTILLPTSVLHLPICVMELPLICYSIDTCNMLQSSLYEFMMLFVFVRAAYVWLGLCVFVAAILLHTLGLCLCHGDCIVLLWCSLCILGSCCLYDSQHLRWALTSLYMLQGSLCILQRLLYVMESPVYGTGSSACHEGSLNVSWRFVCVCVCVCVCMCMLKAFPWVIQLYVCIICFLVCHIDFPSALWGFCIC